MNANPSATMILAEQIFVTTIGGNLAKGGAPTLTLTNFCVVDDKQTTAPRSMLDHSPK